MIRQITDLVLKFRYGLKRVRHCRGIESSLLNLIEAFAGIEEEHVHSAPQLCHGALHLINFIAFAFTVLMFVGVMADKRVLLEEQVSGDAGHLILRVSCGHLQIAIHGLHGDFGHKEVAIVFMVRFVYRKI